MAVLAFSCPSCTATSRPSSPTVKPVQTSSQSRTHTSSRRHRPNPPHHLISLAQEASKLSSARRVLRRKLGVEPHLLDAVSLASTQDSTVSKDETAWRSVFSARNEVTVKWLWLVAAVASKAYATYVRAFPEVRVALSLSDITQEGVCGLIKAVEEWDSSRGYAFEPYAFYCIKHSILRAMENQSRPIRLPVHVLNALAKMRKVRNSLRQDGANGEDDLERVAKEAGVDVERAKLYIERSRGLMSLDAQVKEGGSSLGEFLMDHNGDVVRQVERLCTREAVAELVDGADLGELERNVVLLKYGLADGVERMRAEVSRILKVRVDKVRRAELSALKKLRENIGDNVDDWMLLVR